MQFTKTPGRFCSRGMEAVFFYLKKSMRCSPLQISVGEYSYDDIALMGRRHQVYADEMRAIIVQLYFEVRSYLKPSDILEMDEVYFGSCNVMFEALKRLDVQKGMQNELEQSDARFNFLSSCILLFLNAPSERTIHVRRFMRVKDTEMKPGVGIVMILVAIYYRMYWHVEKDLALESLDVENVGALKRYLARERTVAPFSTPLALQGEICAVTELLQNQGSVAGSQATSTKKRQKLSHADPAEAIKHTRALQAREKAMLSSKEGHERLQVLQVPMAEQMFDAKVPITSVFAPFHLAKRVVYNSKTNGFGFLGSGIVYKITDNDDALEQSFKNTNIVQNGRVLQWHECKHVRQRYLSKKVSFSARYKNKADVSVMKRDNSNYGLDACVVIAHKDESNASRTTSLTWPVSIFKSPKQIEFFSFDAGERAIVCPSISPVLYNKEDLKTMDRVDCKTIISSQTKLSSIFDFSPPVSLVSSIVDEFCRESHAVLNQSEQEALRTECYDRMGIAANNLHVFTAPAHVIAVAIVLKSSPDSRLHAWVYRQVESVTSASCDLVSRAYDKIHDLEQAGPRENESTMGLFHRLSMNPILFSKDGGAYGPKLRYRDVDLTCHETLSFRSLEEECSPDISGDSSVPKQVETLSTISVALLPFDPHSGIEMKLRWIDALQALNC